MIRLDVTVYSTLSNHCSRFGGDGSEYEESICNAVIPVKELGGPNDPRSIDNELVHVLIYSIFF